MRNVGMALLAASLALMGCADTGVIVGFVVDGQSGQRLNFFDNDGSQANADDNDESTKQIYAVIDGEFIRAEVCDSGDATEENKIPMDGCFQIRGIPFGSQVPIFAQYDGYERFQGRVAYPLPMVTDDGVQEQVPQVIANIRMFPRNYSVDYRLFVNKDGRGINEVNVSCQIRQGSNAFATDGDFLVPQNTTSAAITVTSSQDDFYGDGCATLAGPNLVMGARYVCQAFMNGLYMDRGVLSGSVDFVAGVDQAAQTLNVTAQAALDGELIYALSSNVDSPSDLLGNGATMKLIMNRPVEVVRYTEDCQTYRLSPFHDVNGNGNPAPVEPASIPDNNQSEQVRVSITPDGMGVTIAYLPPSPALDQQDTGTTVTFGGIYLKPKGGEKVDGTLVRYIGAPGTCRGAGGLAADARPLKNVRTGGNQSPVLRLF